MKNLFFILFTSLLVMGCDRTTEPTPDPPYLDLSENSIRLNSLGEDVLLDVTHNNVLVKSIPSNLAKWLSLEEGASSDEGTTIVISASVNKSEEDRSGTITFYSEGLSKELVVTQDALSVDVSSPELGFEYGGGSNLVTVSTPIDDWDFSIRSEGGWLSARKEGERDLVVTTESNNTGMERTATIKITAGDLTREVTVTQDHFVFEVAPSLDFEFTGGTRSITVNTNSPRWEWSAPNDKVWLSCQKSGENALSVTLGNNSSTEGRTATISVTAEGVTKEIVVRQFISDSYADRQIVRLQEATVGDGVNIIIMGDGYVASDMWKGGALYERDITAAMEHFFSVYPYSDYREYFNVWTIGAVSNESGASSKNPPVTVDTVFDCLFDGGSSTGIVCNQSMVISYVQPVVELTGKPIEEILVIMPINKATYAGTCLLFQSGFSIAMCPTGETYREIVVHEAGGHGFGKLADEYIYVPLPYPSSQKTVTKRWQESGHFLNIDFSADITNTLWSGFAGNANYPMVGTWEGADLYQYGVWRSEFNSCMNDNVLYFNAQSRYSQMDKIHKLAGEEYSFEQFLEEDIIPPYPAAAKAPGRGVLAPFVPLAPPRLIDDSVL